MIKAQKSCGRCLTMNRKFTGRKFEWWPDHERYCRTNFACTEGLCGSKDKDRQLHFTVCFTHATENQAREDDFAKTLDAKSLPNGLTPTSVRFLHMLSQPMFSAAPPKTCGPNLVPPVVDRDGFEILPDVNDLGLFLMQMIPAETDQSKELLCFYDSGCSAAGLSDRAFNLLNTNTVRPGPTVLDVAGAKSIVIPYGEEQFQL